MGIDQAVELSRAAVMLTLLLSAPVMLVAVVIGLLISILQAVTQLQDQTLSFVPKIVAMLLATLYMLPWVMNQMVEYSTNLIQNIPSLLCRTCAPSRGRITPRRSTWNVAVDEFLNRLFVEPAAQVTLQRLLDLALGQFYAFTLVLVRMSGLMAVGPIFGQAIVPANVRVFIVFTVSLLVTPTLHDQSRAGFQKLDGDRNGRLTREEVPEHLLVRFDHLTDEAPAGRRGIAL
jgi:flagellar biosynthetic protein FliQ